MADMYLESIIEHDMGTECEETMHTEIEDSIDDATNDTETIHNVMQNIIQKVVLDSCHQIPETDNFKFTPYNQIKLNKRSPAIENGQSLDSNFSKFSSNGIDINCLHHKGKDLGSKNELDHQIAVKTLTTSRVNLITSASQTLKTTMVNVSTSPHVSTRDSSTQYSPPEWPGESSINEHCRHCGSSNNLTYTQKQDDDIPIVENISSKASSVYNLRTRNEQ